MSNRELGGFWVALRVSGLALLAAAGCASETDTPGTDLNMVGQGTAGMFAGAAGSFASAGTGAGVGVGVAGSGGAAGMAGVAGTGSAAGMGAAAGSGAAGMDTAGSGAAGTGAAGGTDGMAGMDGIAGSAAGAGGDPMPHEDLGEGDGLDVITIGDSWMNLIITGIEQSLERVSGRNYRNFAVPGTLVLNEQIPNQYAMAISADPDVKTVVMTGGGNDILTSPCTGAACEPIVDDVSARLTELMTQMGEDGVEDVILIGYTYPADQGKHASLDYSIMLSDTFCTKDTLPRCHFLDSTQLSITLQDGIHPNAAGYDLIGTEVWALMQAEGVRR